MMALNDTFVSYECLYQIQSDGGARGKVRGSAKLRNVI